MSEFPFGSPFRTTVLKPKPGGARAARGADPKNETTALMAVIGADDQRGAIDYRAAGMPLLVAAARPMLDVIQHLRNMAGTPDPERLRLAVIEEMRAYERKAASAGVDPMEARVAHYALCATIDDIALATPWGAGSSWSNASVVSTFHRDVVGGERFFDLLEHFHRDPGGNQAILLLFYLCLSLGFKGRLRVSARGALELSQIRDGLYRTLRATMNDVERELSPHWRGVNARHAKARFSQLYSVLLGFLLFLAALGYVGMLRLLNSGSDDMIARAAAMPPLGPASIKIVTVAPPPARQADVLQKFVEFLQPEIEEGLVTTSRRGDEITVRFRNTGLFASGDARLTPKFEAVLDRVGKAIRDAGFSVLVTGHTDNVPISSVRFPSNWHLSQARAKAVADRLMRDVAADRVRFEGRGETEPVDTNDTAQGREANRRTEIVVTARRVAEIKEKNGSGAQP